MPHVSKARSLALIPLIAAGLLATPLPAMADGSAYIANNPRPNASSPRCSSNDYGACSLANRLIADINSASCSKGRIDLLLYSAGNPRLREAVVAKAKCGTKVRLVTSRQKPDGEDQGVEPSEEMGLLIKQLKALKQPVTLGWGALARGGSHGKDYARGKDSAGIQHEKVVAIDKGNGEKIVESDSGNWTFSLDTDQNDRMRMVDRCLYAATVAHMDLLAKDRYVKSEKPARSCDGKRSIYWFPTTHTDPLRTWLKAAKCGKGDTVYAAPFYYAGGRASAYTKELKRLKRSGADVQVAANASWQHWSDYQKRQLVQGGVKVFYVVEYPDGKLKYNHRKVFSADGCSGGPFGTQGSTTVTDTAYESNGNQMVVTRVQADVVAMQRAFRVLVGGKKPLTAKDLGCVGKKQPSGC